MVGTLAAVAGFDRDQRFFLIPAGPLLLVLALALIVSLRVGRRAAEVG